MQDPLESSTGIWGIYLDQKQVSKFVRKALSLIKKISGVQNYLHFDVPSSQLFPYWTITL